jgi:membrane protease YdiL (CAAX protease family)
MPSGQPARAQVVLLALVVEGGLVGLAWLGGWLLGPEPLATFHLEADDALWGVLATLPLLVLFGLCLVCPIPPLIRIRRLTAEVIQPLFAPLGIAELALICLLAGLGEEMLFRGVLQSACSEWLGEFGGLAMASGVFGLCHALTPTYAILATVMGGYLGWIWLASGNLLVPVLAHALYDFVALVIIVHWRFSKGGSNASLFSPKAGGNRSPLPPPGGPGSLQ